MLKKKPKKERDRLKEFVTMLDMHHKKKMKKK